MPYSEHMPALVFPDELKTRQYVAREVIPSEPSLMGKVAFCDWWKPRWNDETKCDSACSGGTIAHNWCFRCPAGYMFMNMTEREFKEGRIGISLSGIEL